MLALLAGLSLSSCQKELSLEDGQGGPVGPAAWEFKEGSAQFRGPIDTVYYGLAGSDSSLTLEGRSSDLKGDFYLELTGAALTAGSYTTPAVVFEYFSEGELLYHNDPQAAGKFTVTITQIGGGQVNGTFTGEVIDSAGNVKTITDGKFSAPLSDETGPAPTACKLSNLASYGLAGGEKIDAVSSQFNAQHQVIKTEVIDSSSQTGGTVVQSFNISYSPGRVDVGPNQYFTLDGSGRISEFHGQDNSTSVPIDAVIKYTYDGSGYMTKAEMFAAAFPIIPLIVYTYEWTGGNLVKVSIELTTGEKTVVEYEYDASKTTKEFLTFNINPEILLFQNAVNYGRNSTNVPVKSTWTEYDASNTATNTYVSEFKNYVLDANNYVTSFEITGDGTVYGAEIKVVLSYKCI